MITDLEKIKNIVLNNSKRVASKLKNAGLWEVILSLVPTEKLLLCRKDSEIIYIALYPNESPICSFGNFKYFYNLNRGFGERCSNKNCNCRRVWKESKSWKRRSVIAQAKRENTIFKNFGVINPSQNKEIQNKKIKTNQNRFGCYWGTQSNFVKNKIKETNQERYGVGSNLQRPEIRKALKQYREKNLADILDKTQKTNLQKYGFKCSLSNEAVKNKVIKTNRERCGFDWTTHSANMKNKSIETCIRKYGVDNVMKSNLIKEKCKQKEMQKTGFNWSAQRVLEYETYSLLNDPIKLQENINKFGVTYLAKQLKIAHTTIYNSVHKHGLKLIENNSYESEIENWLLEQNLNFIRHDRQQIKPKELDFYLPAQHLAIEFQGTYWHMDPKIFEATDFNQSTHKTAQDHWNMDIQKINICASHDICLMIIWENDWNNDKESIKKHILNTIKELT